MLRPVETIEIGKGSEKAFDLPVQKRVSEAIRWIEGSLIAIAAMVVIAGVIYVLARRKSKKSQEVEEGLFEIG